MNNAPDIFNRMMGYLLAKMGVCHGQLVTISSAQDELMEFKLRTEDGGEWCFNSDEKLEPFVDSHPIMMGFSSG